MTTQQAIKQLERSERGQQTVKLFRDLIKSHAVSGLNSNNSKALVTLAENYLCKDANEACQVMEEINGLINRNQWVTK